MIKLTLLLSLLQLSIVNCQLSIPVFYLLLSIISSSLLIIIFKYYEKFGINTLHAIVVNYMVAAALGFYCNESETGIAQIPSQPWFIHAFILGLMFIIVFNIIALSSQKVGISATAVANKMSVVIPVAAAIILYHDKLNLLKAAGIMLGLVAVYCSSSRGSIAGIDKKYLLLPLIIFFCSGFFDSAFKYMQTYYLQENQHAVFVSTIFAVAAITGMAAILYMVIFKQSRFSVRSIAAGIILGIPNYGSVYFLLKTLNIPRFESSVIFPINNMGTVALSTLMAFVLFREKLSVINWMGLLLSLVAIGMIAYR